ncbi:MAG: ammonium transporter [Sphingobium sp.]
MRLLPAVILSTAFIAAPDPAIAQVAVADSGDTGWMMLCALLVLFAALPGLLMRHAGMVNVRNALSVGSQGLIVAAGTALAWGIVGYSLAYAPGGGWLGGGANLLLANLGQLREGLTVPESAFALFQMTLGIFAACLLAGAVAERARFGWIALFAPLWCLLVYAPIAHWVWGGGFLADMGVMDFAGGLVMQVTAGFAALVLALIAGRRTDPSHPGHGPVLSLAGGALVWVGWSGIVGGWALGATDDAATAILNLHFAACAGLFGWAIIDKVLTGRVSATGLLSGAIAALAAISAAAGLVGTEGAMLIGLIAAIVCRTGATIADALVDDPAHVFAVHGLGGLTGILLLPLFTLPLMGGVGFEAGVGAWAVLVAQVTGLAVVGGWALLGTAIIALTVSFIVPLRVGEAEEAEGLDASHHDQQAWDFR